MSKTKSRTTKTTAAHIRRNSAGLLAADPRNIAEAAYFKAERRGFAPGHELSDWLEAERDMRPEGKPAAYGRAQPSAHD